MTRLYQLPHSDWQSTPDKQAISALENGHVLFFPQLTFDILPEETAFISPDYSDGKSKNISYSLTTEELKGSKNDHPVLKNLMKRYAETSTRFLKELAPDYVSHLQIGRTSLRPVEIAGRKADSYKKDDTRLHVDAFPSNPNQGKRILRIFCNINPSDKPRVWKIGESFETVAKTFLPQIPAQLPLSSKLLKLLNITKSLRTPYDHIMLNIHDRMKKDMNYQKRAEQMEVAFPVSTWLVYTDCVSHAALSGQHLLEQTFYLPIEGMLDENKSPLKILEKLTRRKLI